MRAPQIEMKDPTKWIVRLGGREPVEVDVDDIRQVEKFFDDYDQETRTELGMGLAVALHSLRTDYARVVEDLAKATLGHSDKLIAEVKNVATAADVRAESMRQDLTLQVARANKLQAELDHLRKLATPSDVMKEELRLVKRELEIAREARKAVEAERVDALNTLTRTVFLDDVTPPGLGLMETANAAVNEITNLRTRANVLTRHREESNATLLKFMKDVQAEIGNTDVILHPDACVDRLKDFVKSFGKATGLITDVAADRDAARAANKKLNAEIDRERTLRRMAEEGRTEAELTIKRTARELAIASDKLIEETEAAEAKLPRGTSLWGAWRTWLQMMLARLPAADSATHSALVDAFASSLADLGVLPPTAHRLEHAIEDIAAARDPRASMSRQPGETPMDHHKRLRAAGVPYEETKRRVVAEGGGVVVGPAVELLSEADADALIPPERRTEIAGVSDVKVYEPATRMDHERLAHEGDDLAEQLRNLSFEMTSRARHADRPPSLETLNEWAGILRAAAEDAELEDALVKVGAAAVKEKENGRALPDAVFAAIKAMETRA